MKGETMRHVAIVVLILLLVSMAASLVLAQDKPKPAPATVTSSAATMQLAAPSLSEVATLRVMIFASDEDKLTAQFRLLLTERAQFTAMVEQQITGYTMDWSARPPKLVKLPEKPTAPKPEKK